MALARGPEMSYSFGTEMPNLQSLVSVKLEVHVTCNKMLLNCNSAGETLRHSSCCNFAVRITM